MFIWLALPLLFLICGNCNSSYCPGCHGAAFSRRMDAQHPLSLLLIPPCRAVLPGDQAGMQPSVRCYTGIRSPPEGKGHRTKDQRPVCPLTHTLGVFFKGSYCDCVALGSALRSLGRYESNPMHVCPRGGAGNPCTKESPIEMARAAFLPRVHCFPPSPLLTQNAREEQSFPHA